MLLPLSITLATSAAFVLASPLEARGVKTVPLKHVAHIDGNPKGIVQRGRARINEINGGSSSAFSPDVSSGPATNEIVSYLAAVTIGGNTWNLIVDTGSSNTWCGAQTACERTSTGTSLGKKVKVSYGSGSFVGTEYTDQVTFAGLTVTQSIGAATKAKGFRGVDGIIGFGPVDLTQGTVRKTSSVPTFMDNLYSKGLISAEVLGVSFQPNTGNTALNNGELTLGGVDSSKYTGSITYNPSQLPYWGLTISSITYGSTTLATGASSIVDTGTTLIYIPSSAYSQFLSSSGGTTDSASGFPSWPSSSPPTQTVTFNVGSNSYTLTPSQYLIPTGQYSFWGLSSGKVYGWINNGGSSGLTTVLGQKFLESYYSVYDTTNQRVGFAPAA